MKWITPILFGISILAFIYAKYLNNRYNYEDGTPTLEIICLVSGISSLMISITLFIVLTFEVI